MSRSRIPLLFTLLAPLCGSAPFLMPIGCSPQAQAAGTLSSVPSTPVVDATLAPERIELLDIAFRAASAFPAKPHIKNRSRVQESVVEVCLELDQPRRALGFAEQIASWRRGAALADFAFYCAEHGDAAEALQQLELAGEIARQFDVLTADEDSTAQGWQRDRIRSKIARAYLRLGRVDDARQFEADLAPSEAGRVAAVRATQIDAMEFDQHLNTLDTLVLSGNFDQLRGALEAYAQLYDRFYADAKRREKLEGRIDVAWKKLPIQVRVESSIELIQSALGHSDQVHARELVAKALALVDGSTWTPESGIPLRAQLAELRNRAGEAEQARHDADAALVIYEAQRGDIVDIYRAGTLRPLAEVYLALGDGAKALELYRKTLEEGVLNPNSRPRAEDLVATCCSLASHGLAPDAELRRRLIQIFDGLGDPW